MVKEIRWSAKAEQQLTNILLYYHYETGNKFALRLLDKIMHITELLLTNPKLGFVEPRLQIFSREYRSVIEGYYKIIYQEKTDYIKIIAIFDCRQNPDKLSQHL